MTRHVAVIGGGISGLAAALRLSESGVAVTIVEQADRLGGKLHTRADGVELGAEQFLMRDPAWGPSGAMRLVSALKLEHLLEHPIAGGAGLWVAGALRPLPTGTVMGVPGPDTDLVGVATLSQGDVDRGAPVLAPREDRAVGDVVRERLGDEVVTHLVDPLLGGVYAGSADGLSLAATMPALHRFLGREHTLRAAVQRAAGTSRAHQPGTPVFGTLRGGLGTLVQAARAELERRGVEIHLGMPVRELVRTADGWTLTVGAATDDAPRAARPWRLDADAVVLAVPARPAARLLAPTAPEAAEHLGVLEYANVGLVTLTLPGVDLPALSGFLVPADQGLTIKAATFFSTKWEHHRRSDGSVLLRASVGRHGDHAVLQRPDAEIVATVRADLSAVLGTSLPEPAAATVTRWGGALPQYAPGHVERVANAREALAELPLVLVGAAFDGVGIPACVNSAELAADLLLRGWE
ncbi:protoporphyrinogen oxidase [Catellatospora sp. TT07R-123]|uniref:protoporphyrinogen oxidase n=1 Tax=Catellatospora sp. TT07R-123 TaxID=2733863 RepID=UPI001B0E740E|nr:protoporphyrinogen oxidase [Catellatospora sp. TT07R-123]GHJ49613.1 protoporphyrinogen oxidase [Catellatospora sp. TT07R-123]